MLSNCRTNTVGITIATDRIGAVDLLFLGQRASVFRLVTGVNLPTLSFCQQTVTAMDYRLWTIIDNYWISFQRLWCRYTHGLVEKYSENDRSSWSMNRVKYSSIMAQYWRYTSYITKAKGLKPNDPLLVANGNDGNWLFRRLQILPTKQM